jgi:hypothetical protein
MTARPGNGTLRLMLTDQIVVLLIAERDRLNQAIEVLQGPTKRRGRPPKNPFAHVVAAATAVAAVPAKKKRTFTAAQRKQQAKRMKAYWAKKKAK